MKKLITLFLLIGILTFSAPSVKADTLTQEEISNLIIQIQQQIADILVQIQEMLAAQNGSEQGGSGYVPTEEPGDTGDVEETEDPIVDNDEPVVEEEPVDTHAAMRSYCESIHRGYHEDTNSCGAVLIRPCGWNGCY